MSNSFCVSCLENTALFDDGTCFDCSAHELVLTWCCSNAAKAGGRVPAMRTPHAVNAGKVPACYVIDAACFEPTRLAAGNDWTEVAAQLGVYGPQWEPAPVRPIDTNTANVILTRRPRHTRSHYRRGARR